VEVTGKDPTTKDKPKEQDAVEVTGADTTQEEGAVEVVNQCLEEETAEETAEETRQDANAVEGVNANNLNSSETAAVCILDIMISFFSHFSILISLSGRHRQQQSHQRSCQGVFC
jgi:indole-3-glycerol phosphate synthase